MSLREEGYCGDRGSSAFRLCSGAPSEESCVITRTDAWISMSQQMQSSDRKKALLWKSMQVSVLVAYDKQNTKLLNQLKEKWRVAKITDLSWIRALDLVIKIPYSFTDVPLAKSMPQHVQLVAKSRVWVWSWIQPFDLLWNLFGQQYVVLTRLDSKTAQKHCCRVKELQFDDKVLACIQEA